MGTAGDNGGTWENAGGDAGRQAEGWQAEGGQGTDGARWGHAGEPSWQPQESRARPPQAAAAGGPHSTKAQRGLRWSVSDTETQQQGKQGSSKAKRQGSGTRSSPSRSPPGVLPAAGSATRARPRRGPARARGPKSQQASPKREGALQPQSPGYHKRIDKLISWNFAALTESIDRTLSGGTAKWRRGKGSASSVNSRRPQPGKPQSRALSSDSSGSKTPSPATVNRRRVGVPGRLQFESPSARQEEEGEWGQRFEDAGEAEEGEIQSVEVEGPLGAHGDEMEALRRELQELRFEREELEYRLEEALESAAQNERRLEEQLLEQRMLVDSLTAHVALLMRENREVRRERQQAKEEAQQHRQLLEALEAEGVPAEVLREPSTRPGQGETGEGFLLQGVSGELQEAQVDDGPWQHRGSERELWRLEERLQELSREVQSLRDGREKLFLEVFVEQVQQRTLEAQGRRQAEEEGRQAQGQAQAVGREVEGLRSELEGLRRRLEEGEPRSARCWTCKR